MADLGVIMVMLAVPVVLVVGLVRLARRRERQHQAEWHRQVEGWVQPPEAPGIWVPPEPPGR